MKSVYTGGEKVAEFESYDELRVGENKSAFIYEGSELVYPNPVKDGLVLWYDFSGRTNTDSQRGIAEDLSGNDNHGTLQNFNYTSKSGYDKNKLLFDGVDDGIFTGIYSKDIDASNSSYSITMDYSELGSKAMWSFYVSFTNGLFFLIYKSGIGDRLGYYTTGRNNNYSNFNPKLNKPFNVTINILNKKVSLIVNGVLEGEVEDNGLSIIDLIQISNKPQHIGNIYSLKTYNRPLTPEEIAHNYAIEKERFGIE